MAGTLHDKLARKSLVWLHNRATAKGIAGATEVWLADRYVADAVALCSLQRQFFEKYVQPEARADVLKQRSEANYFACVFEVKVSKQDFNKTFGAETNRLTPVGSLHWVVAPRFMVKKVPAFWGLLEARYRGLTEVIKPKFQPLTQRQLDRIAHCLIWPMTALRTRFWQMEVYKKLLERNE